MIIESPSEHNTNSDAKQREATVQETDRWHPYSTVHVVQGRELATRHMEKRTNTQAKSSVHRCSIDCRARIIVLRSLPRSCVAIRKMFLKLRFPFFLLRRCKFRSHPLDKLLWRPSPTQRHVEKKWKPSRPSIVLSQNAPIENQKV